MATYNSLGYFGAQLDSEIAAEPALSYAILSSPRTGSNYLCARLSNVKDRFGFPMEYLHADAIRLMGARLLPGVTGNISLESYLLAVARVRTSRDGWFGTKIQPEQLLPPFGGNIDSAIAFLRGFDRLILLTRRDKLGQAISGAIAHATGEWFNFGEEPKLDGIDPARLFPLVETLQRQYIREDRLIGLVGARLADQTPLHVCYEEIQEDSEGVFRRIVTFLEPEGPVPTEERVHRPPTRKPPGGFSTRLREAYLQHRTDILP